MSVQRFKDVCHHTYLAKSYRKSKCKIGFGFKQNIYTKCSKKSYNKFDYIYTYLHTIYHGSQTPVQPALARCVPAALPAIYLSIQAYLRTTLLKWQQPLQSAFDFQFHIYQIDNVHFNVWKMINLVLSYDVASQCVIY